MQRAIPCTIMRGGTSKGIFLMENNLPQDPKERNRIILRVFGSPDRRQIDGLGGADLLTSKLAIIGPPSRTGVDVDYTFGQISLTQAEVDYGSTCGNISSAVGPFAIDQGIVRATEPKTRVRIHALPWDRVITADVEVKEGKAAVEGDFAIDGVPGTGAKITMDWADMAGAQTGKLLPSGKVKERIDVKGVGALEVSIVDAPHVTVYVRAKDIGMTGTESPVAIDGNKELVQRIEAVRRHVGAMFGMEEQWERYASPNLPIFIMVQAPTDYVNYSTGKPVKAADVDVLVKLYAAGMTHKAFGGTTIFGAGAAAKIEGTVIHEMLSERGHYSDAVRLGHPSGVALSEVVASRSNGGWKLDKALMWRTARRIMDGYVYV